MQIAGTLFFLSVRRDWSASNRWPASAEDMFSGRTLTAVRPTNLTERSEGDVGEELAGD